MKIVVMLVFQLVVDGQYREVEGVREGLLVVQIVEQGFCRINEEWKDVQMKVREGVCLSQVWKYLQVEVLSRKLGVQKQLEGFVQFQIVSCQIFRRKDFWNLQDWIQSGIKVRIGIRFNIIKFEGLNFFRVGSFGLGQKDWVKMLQNGESGNQWGDVCI